MELLFPPEKEKLEGKTVQRTFHAIFFSYSYFLCSFLFSLLCITHNNTFQKKQKKTGTKLFFLVDITKQSSMHFMFFLLFFVCCCFFFFIIFWLVSWGKRKIDFGSSSFSMCMYLSLIGYCSVSVFCLATFLKGSRARKEKKPKEWNERRQLTIHTQIILSTTATPHLLCFC